MYAQGERAFSESVLKLQIHGQVLQRPRVPQDYEEAYAKVNLAAAPGNSICSMGFPGRIRATPALVPRFWPRKPEKYQTSSSGFMRN